MSATRKPRAKTSTEAKARAVVDEAARLDLATYGCLKREMAAKAQMGVGDFDAAVKARRAELKQQSAEARAAESEPTPASAVLNPDELERLRSDLDADVATLASLPDDTARELALPSVSQKYKIPKPRLHELVYQERCRHNPKLPAPLKNGSQVDIAEHLTDALKKEHADGVPFTLGDFFTWDQSEGRWKPLPVHDMHKRVHGYNNLPISGGGTVNLSQGSVEGILKAGGMILCQPGFFEGAPPGINCKNGFIRFDEDTFEPRLQPHVSGHLQLHTLDAGWHEGASDKIPSDTLFHMLLAGAFQGDPDAEEKLWMLQEFYGAAAAGIGTKIAGPKALILWGPEAENGKGQILNTMRGLLPESAISNVSPSDLSDQHSRIKLAGKHLNTSDELGTSHAIAGDKFKSVITGDPISGRDLYQTLTTFRPQAQHVFAANILPPFSGGMDRGVQRRLMLIKMLRSIPKKEQRPGLGQLIATKEGDLVLAWAVAGATRLLKRGRFEEPSWAKRALNEWATMADPVIAWCEARMLHANDRRKRVSAALAYASFHAWAKLQGYNMGSLPARNAFTQRAHGELAKRGIKYDSSGGFRGFFNAELAPVEGAEREAMMRVLSEMENEAIEEARRVAAGKAGWEELAAAD